MQPATEFLTPAESAAVDRALLTSRDKFTTRVAIYALRSLKQIATQSGQAIAELQPAQIEDWVYQDQTLQPGLDQDFRQFFLQLVVASKRPLAEAAVDRGVAIEALTVDQVVTWFEKLAKQRLERDAN